MRVYEVAREFQIETEKLLTLLRGMGVQVRSEAAAVEDTVVAKLRARFERERRAGHGDAEESLEAVLEQTSTATRRRRRKKADIEVEAPEVEEPVEAAPEPVAAEAEPVASPVLEVPQPVAEA